MLNVNLIFAQGKERPQKCILVFGSHADDVETMAGGTFAKYIAEGYKGVYVCVMNNLAGCAIEGVGGGTSKGDNPGSVSVFTVSGSQLPYPVDALETQQIRQEEGLQAAKVFGAESVFLNFCEPEIWLGRRLIIYGTEEFLNYNPPGRKQVSLATRYSEDVNFVVDLLRNYQPEITIIHTLGGEKLDHGESGYLMYLAFKEAMRKGVPVGKLWMRSHGWLSDKDAQKNGRGKPDVRINVNDYIKTKYAAFDCHVSQKGVSENLIRPEEAIEEFITVIDNMK
jgi:LmbE family N-acetylglucosaminyl deacetylase